MLCEACQGYCERCEDPVPYGKRSDPPTVAAFSAPGWRYAVAWRDSDGKIEVGRFAVVGVRVNAGGWAEFLEADSQGFIDSEEDSSNSVRRYYHESEKAPTDAEITAELEAKTTQLSQPRPTSPLTSPGKACG